MGIEDKIIVYGLFGVIIVALVVGILTAIYALCCCIKDDNKHK